jgi:hypothetical protein
MRARRLLIGLATALLLGGLFLGFIAASVSAPGGQRVSCGSPWAKDTDAIRAAEVADERAIRLGLDGAEARDWSGMCNDAFGSRTGWAIGLVLIGAIGLLGIGLSSMRVGEPAAPESS